MTRFHLVAYDLGPTSPAQPRLHALTRELSRRGHPVELWTAVEPEPGAYAVVRVRVDPLARRRVQVGTWAAGRAARPSPVRRLVRQIGRTVDAALLFPDGEVLWS